MRSKGRYVESNGKPDKSPDDAIYLSPDRATDQEADAANEEAYSGAHEGSYAGSYAEADNEGRVVPISPMRQY